MKYLEVVPAVKSFFQQMPWPIGRAIAAIPYQYRFGLGRVYAMRRREIEAFDKASVSDQQAFILLRTKESVRKAWGIPFYRELYQANSVGPEDIKTLADISKLPIVTKEMLKNYPLEQRSQVAKGRYKGNTGGTSGSTLDFYITPELIPNEWAHIHTIWGKLGFTQDQLKLVFAGGNIGQKNLQYDGLRHSYKINVYRSFAEVFPELELLVHKRKIRFLHGYPSALAEFARELKVQRPNLLELLKRDLRGVFMGSEYPVPAYRKEIEETFGVPSISWYGHTERAILAWEKEEAYSYHPFQTYGFCEAIKNDEGDGWRLVGTSYYNHASPFIRYDTGDDIEPILIENGILRSFRIKAGRIGNFVVDSVGVKIPLTALIFGRHHPLFDVARFVQVRQVEPGAMTILITPKANFPGNFIFDDWFDRSALDMDVDFEIIDAPVLTQQGKVPLKV